MLSVMWFTRSSLSRWQQLSQHLHLDVIDLRSQETHFDPKVHTGKYSVKIRGYSKFTDRKEINRRASRSDQHFEFVQELCDMLCVVTLCLLFHCLVVFGCFRPSNTFLWNLSKFGRDWISTRMILLRCLNLALMIMMLWHTGAYVCRHSC